MSCPQGARGRPCVWGEMFLSFVVLLSSNWQMQFYQWNGRLFFRTNGTDGAHVLAAGAGGRRQRACAPLLSRPLPASQGCATALCFCVWKGCVLHSCCAAHAPSKKTRDVLPLTAEARAAMWQLPSCCRGRSRPSLGWEKTEERWPQREWHIMAGIAKGAR
jgi:hypothetical protein